MGSFQKVVSGDCESSFVVKSVGDEFVPLVVGS